MKKEKVHLIFFPLSLFQSLFCFNCYFEAILTSRFLSYFHGIIHVCFVWIWFQSMLIKFRSFIFIYIHITFQFFCKKKVFVEFKFCDFIKRYLVPWCIIVLILLDILKFYNVVSSVQYHDFVFWLFKNVFKANLILISQWHSNSRIMGGVQE